MNALRHPGTARTHFSVAPFLGAVLAVLMGDAVTLLLLRRWDQHHIFMTAQRARLSAMARSTNVFN